MNDAQAIAHTTKALRDAVRSAVQGSGMNPLTTVLPPDVARVGQSENQVNIFLYHLSTNAAWRNRDLPRPVREGELSRPLLPLNLYYLVTAYAGNAEEVDCDIKAHALLGYVLRRLHSQPILAGDELEFSLQLQPEPPRITLQPLSLDEIARLWSSFQTPYRPSAVYEVAPLLITHESPGAAPLPVLQRGEGDRGWDVGVEPLPVIEQTQYVPPRELADLLAGRRPLDPRPIVKRQFGARLGGGLLLRGHHLSRIDRAALELRHQSVKETRAGVVDKLTRIVEPLRVDRDSLLVALPADPPEAWPAGVYLATVRSAEDTQQKLRTNSVPIALVPQLLEINDPDGVAGQARTIQFRFHPPIDASQQRRLLVGGREFIPQLGANAAADVELPAGFPAEVSYARLRVDGIDSLLYDPDQPDSTAAEFEPRFLVKKAP